MTIISLSKPFGFSLAAATTFYAGFTPGSGMAGGSHNGALRLAFRVDRSFSSAVVTVRERGEEIVLDVAGAEGEAAVVCRQVSRMLGLDVDGRAWLDVGRRDPVVGMLQRQFKGFFTAAKASPYDAAAWGVIAQRLPMKQAARIKQQLAEQHGDVVVVRAVADDVGGARVAVFPSPQQLLAVRAVPGLAEVKLARLHAMAHAALEGVLDAERLRAMPVGAALALLEELPGVGPWTAAHILFRGCAVQDAFPMHEPRVLHGLRAAMGREDVDEEDAIALSSAWRPFRMWVAILLARHLMAVGGWQKRGLQEERAAASRRRRVA